MTISCVIVSYNTKEILEDCLLSLYLSLKYLPVSDYEVIVVDNNSQDQTRDMVSKRFPRVKLIENQRNSGFAKANNQGIKESSGEYILLLNSDTKLMKNTISKLVEGIKHQPAVGVVGGKLIGKDGKCQPSCGYLPSLFNIFLWMSFLDDIPILSINVKAYHMDDTSFYKKRHSVGWVSGACFLVRREAVRRAGMLDEKIFMYGEEVEWCYRIKKEGFKVIYIPEAELIHLKGGSGEGANSGIVEEFKFMAYFYKKHKASWQRPILIILLRCGALLRRVIFGIIGKYKARATLYAKAYHVVR